MINAHAVKDKITSLLDQSKVEYLLYEHQPVLSYEDSYRIQKEVGYQGTEGKSLVLKLDSGFMVYFTVEGNRVNFDEIKKATNSRKIRLASAQELRDHFGAEPGCAYPFGFNKDIDIYVDPTIFSQDWIIFSPCLPTFTVQARGSDLDKLFRRLDNAVITTNHFNL